MFFLLLASFVFGWSGEPHEFIVQIALQQLSEKERNWITKLLRYWPSESQDINLVANWQDMIGYEVGKAFSQWHFVTTPIIEAGYTPAKIKYSFNVTSYLYDGISAIMDESTTSIWSLLFHIRSLIHFVGDIHCPVHAMTYYGQDYPTGDAGGNGRSTDCSKVVPGEPYFCGNLHKVWDSGILSYDSNKYTAPSMPEFWDNITQLQLNYPKSSLESYLNVMSPADWAKESYDTAVKYAYGYLENETIVNQRYFDECFPQAQLRITLAGYRLGNVLKEFFNERGFIRLPSDPIYSSEVIAWVLDALVFTFIVVYVVLIVRENSRKYD